MQVLLLGAGTVTSRLNMQLAEQGHSVIAQIAAFTPQHIDLFDFRALIGFTLLKITLHRGCDQECRGKESDDASRSNNTAMRTATP